MDHLAIAKLARENTLIPDGEGVFRTVNGRFVIRQLKSNPCFASVRDTKNKVTRRIYFHEDALQIYIDGYTYGEATRQTED